MNTNSDFYLNFNDYLEPIEKMKAEIENSLRAEGVIIKDDDETESN